jgi:hypothetical protein
MTALISDSLTRRGAELARRRVEIATSRMASKRNALRRSHMSTVEHKIYANSSTGEDLLLCVRVRPVQTVAVSTYFYFFSEG